MEALFQSVWLQFGSAGLLIVALAAWGWVNRRDRLAAETARNEFMVTVWRQSSERQREYRDIVEKNAAANERLAVQIEHLALIMQMKGNNDAGHE